MVVVCTGEEEITFLENGRDKTVTKHKVKQYQYFTGEYVIRKGEPLGVVKDDIFSPFTIEYFNGGLNYTITAQVANAVTFLKLFEKIGCSVYDASDID